MPAIQQAKIDELLFDPRNANRGTERGRALLDRSLRQYGAGRSILLDKHNRIIAGNKTTEVAADIGLEKVLIVETDGTELVAVKRTDLDLDDKPARELAYADNRVTEIDLDWSAAQLVQDAAQGIDLDQFFRPDELDALLRAEETANQAEPDVTIFEQAVQLMPPKEYLVILCNDDAEFDQLRLRLQLKTVKRGGYADTSALNALGVERVIPAQRLLERLKDADRDAE